MILCGGDALIDFVPVDHGGETAFLPRAGGAVLNAATAVARLEEEVAFIGGLSNDLFGDILAAHLAREGIETGHISRSDADSTLAFVTLSDGEARYAFYDATSAGRHWTGAAELPEAKALHIGSVTLIADPSASAWEDVATRARQSMVVSLDPNCRPGLIADKAAYAARIQRLAALSHIVRFSDEDFDYLYPDASEESVAADLLKGATELVLISRGADGATAFHASGRIDVDAQTVQVQDSIGAGDTFHAGVLAALSKAGHLSAAGLTTLDAKTLRKALDFATTAAALNCAQSGCSPPPLEDVYAALAPSP
ncbi:MAG: carbohydrate kinase [Paracoccaceae bacterium]|nr:carbohydrate kinase [Paracoccaceae bacterium]